MDNAQRQKKERFMSGHGGTTSIELILLLLAPGLLYLLIPRLTTTISSSQKIFRLLLELIVLLAGPCWIICNATNTLYKSLTSLSMVTFTITIFILLRSSKQSLRKQLNYPTQIPFVTIYRSYLMMLTVFAILAVDFTIFPRRFAKTEMYGVSLMDIGVGCFIFSNAVVGGIAKARRLSIKSFTQPHHHLIKTIIKTIPLWVLGIIRIITTKGINYQEHVSEYGTHWNFFFTLAILPIITSFTNRITSKHLLTLSFITSILHQSLLTTLGDNYIANAPRTTLFSANREGLLSLPGYLSLYLLGTWTGIQTSQHSSNRFLSIIILAITSSLFYSIGYLFNLQASRRTANPMFVVWTTAMNIYVLLSFWLTDCQIIPRLCSMAQSSPSILMESINNNQLAVFLIANLLTGLVNITQNTLVVSNTTATIILVLYMTTVSLIAYLLNVYNIRIKL